MSLVVVFVAITSLSAQDNGLGERSRPFGG